MKCAMLHGEGVVADTNSRSTQGESNPRDFTCPMIGRSPAFIHSLQLLKRAAQRDVTVLLQGETGTGKELAAHAIHYNSARSNASFIPLNCGSLPDTLVESELFGHVRGAFTDAHLAKRGLVTEAEGGTLFLDEVDSLSPKAQVTLLRFLQDGGYRPLGTARALPANVRILAASNANLAELCALGQFRPDLYYRLCLLTIDLPPLRERGDDVGLLADFFLQRFAQMYDVPSRRLDSESRDWIRCHSWPGNIRELEHLLHREFLVSDALVMHLPQGNAFPAMERSPAALDFSLKFSAAKTTVLHAFERAYLLHVLAEARGNVSAAARRSGKERRSFGRLLKKHHIDPQLFV